jgi:N-methylhydantoinase A
MNNPEINSLRIGIDIGGTFTDFVIAGTNGELFTFKLPTTPDDPSKAVLSGLERIREYQNGSKNWNASLHSVVQANWQIIHGSTVATNALLERKGAKTAFVTSTGFKDIIQIGRQNRPELYDFHSEPIQPLVPPDLRFEVDERIDSRGSILVPVEEKQVDDLIHQLKEGSNSNLRYTKLEIPDEQVSTEEKIDPVESVAVVFLFSFTNPNHEVEIAERLRQEGYFVSASSEVLPEYREYERASTTVINAYVSPVLNRYLGKLETLTGEVISSEENQPDNQDDKKISIQVMQSNGGCISVAEARNTGVKCVLSGPAGGVVGSWFIGQRKTRGEVLGDLSAEADPLKLLTFDMGGTSTDVSLIDGEPKIASDAEIGGFPIRVPILDIHTIGAGGGSIGRVDAGGILRVGPESAGADPGPACYGNSLMPTVTDANLLLGRILPEHFLGGEMELHPELSDKAVTSLGNQLNLDKYQTALGIIEIANAHMVRALRVISVERGYDPRDFTLLSFGGAGGLHAVSLARELDNPRVLVPKYASTLSAFGMLTADVAKEYSLTVMLPGRTKRAEIDRLMHPMAERGINEIQAEGFDLPDIQIERYLDMRYVGQSYELTIPLSREDKDEDDYPGRFHLQHQRTYGFKRITADMEIVNLRVRAKGFVSPPRFPKRRDGGPDPAHALIGYRKVIFPAHTLDIPIYHSEKLVPGNMISGPALIVRDDTTILLEHRDRGMVDSFENIEIEIARKVSAS